MVAVSPFMPGDFHFGFAAPTASNSFHLGPPGLFLSPSPAHHPGPPIPSSSATPRREYDSNAYVALDAEFVGTGDTGAVSTLARVSIVSYHGSVLLDTFCAPSDRVTDYRSWVSGIREADLVNAPPFAAVQAQVRDIIANKVLVGHAIHNDLEVLNLTHPLTHIRDTFQHEPLRRLSGTDRPSLRALAKIVLSLDVQTGEHSSVEDARATMSIFRAYQDQWEASLDVPAPLVRRAPQVHRPPPFAAHADRTGPLHNHPRYPSAPVRPFAGPSPAPFPRVNLPPPVMASPPTPLSPPAPTARINAMYDPRFSAAAKALPSKRPTPQPQRALPPPSLAPVASTSSVTRPLNSRAPDPPTSTPTFQPGPPPPFAELFQGQPLLEAFPPLSDGRVASPDQPASPTEAGAPVRLSGPPRADRLSMLNGLANLRRAPTPAGPAPPSNGAARPRRDRSLTDPRPPDPL